MYPFAKTECQPSRLNTDVPTVALVGMLSPLANLLVGAATARRMARPMRNPCITRPSASDWKASGSPRRLLHQQVQAAVPPAAPSKQHPKAKGYWKNKKQAQGGYKPGSSGAHNEVSILKAQVQQLQQQVNTKQNYNQVPPPASQAKTESSTGSQDEQGGQPAPTTI